MYRTELDFKQGASDATFYPITFAAGAGSRMELFGAFRAVTHIDRDTRPLFAPAAASEAGLVNDYPLVRTNWTGSEFGDAYVGAKINFMSEHRRQPMAMAFRGTVKLPTAGEDTVGTGQFDYIADLVLSKEVRQQGGAGRVWRLHLSRRPDGCEPLGRTALGRRGGVRAAVQRPVHDGAVR